MEWNGTCIVCALLCANGAYDHLCVRYGEGPLEILSLGPRNTHGGPVLVFQSAVLFCT